MKRLAFTMQLRKGFEAEYEKRHQEIWPELSDLLLDSGIERYSIFLDSETGTLFAYMEVQETNGLADLPKHSIMQKWWSYMKDIMDTQPDNVPISNSLKEVFHLS
ncbi:MAG: L-rhamnose mutarotase [Sediminibacterium sp.]|nr:L-rhamnose mutarotase [Sediminibacterium sp.]